MSTFTTYWVAPKTPTTLEDHQWLPLPPSDHPFYPMVNSWTVPEPLDVARLCEALAQALSIYPLNASQLARNPANDLWQLQLVNRTVPLTIGQSDRPGLFAEDWQGEKDPDYYIELPRHGNSLQAYSLMPLTNLKVTTYRATGQTSIMLTQSYNLGDGFAVTGFMKAWSQFYQGKEPDFVPTFEKYFLPTPRMVPSASHSKYLDNISWLAIDFADDTHERISEEMHCSTQRLDMTFDASFLDGILQQARSDSRVPKLSMGDAFAAYLITTLRGLLDPAPQILQQCVGYRGQTMEVNGSKYHLPYTTLGNNYFIHNLNVDRIRDVTSISEVALALNQSRREMADEQYLSRLFSYYSYFYERASSAGRAPMDSGHADAIAINNCIKLELTGPDFGYPGQSGQVEWEVLENFIQIMHANPVRQSDGSYSQNPGDLSIVTRLPRDIIPKFRAKVDADMKRYFKHSFGNVHPSSAVPQARSLYASSKL